MTKYRAIKTECDSGHTHDSKMEAARCDQLTAMERAGEIEQLEQQPSFVVEIEGKHICRYIADFAWTVGACRIVEDVKGVQTSVFNLKRKLVEATHPGLVVTVYPPRKRKKRAKKAK